MKPYVIPFEQLGMHDVERVGGKNASLGEMIGKLGKLGVQVPTGFATTADAYRDFLAQQGLAGRIAAQLGELDVDDVEKLAATGAAFAWNGPFSASLVSATFYANTVANSQSHTCTATNKKSASSSVVPGWLTASRTVRM